MQRFNLFLPKPILDELYKLSLKLDISQSEIIRMALKEYLEKLKTKESKK